MAISFPTGLDSFTTRNSGDTISEDHVNDLQDAVEALEAKVGVDTSAVTSSHDYLITNASSSDPGHKHTLANGATDVNATASEVNVAADLTVNNFFGAARAVYFWEDTAPTGWTIDATAADCVLAVKGGTQDYNVSGGTKAASSWTAFGLGDHAAHNHQWYDVVTNSTHRSFNSGGTAGALSYGAQDDGGDIALGIHTDDSAASNPTPLDTDYYTANEAAMSHTFDGTWRPPGGVGIIATKDA